MRDPLGLLPDTEPQDPLGLLPSRRPGQSATLVTPESEVMDNFFGVTRDSAHYASDWWNASMGILKTAPMQIASGLLGFITMLDDVASGLPREKRILSIGKYTKVAADHFTDWISRESPRLGHGSPEYYYYNAMSSVLTNLPSLALGFATGSQALALLSMGAQVAGNKYLEEIEKGTSQDRAAIASGMYGVAEAIGEKIPLGFLMKNKGLRAILLSSLTELPSELGTELMQTGIDMGILDEKMSLSQFLNRMKETAIVTGISAPITAVAGRGIGHGFEARYARKLEEARAKQPVKLEVVEPEVVTPEITFETEKGRTVAKAGDTVLGTYDGKRLTIKEQYEGDRLRIAEGLLSDYRESLKSSFVETESGSFDFGQIDPDIASSVGIQSAPIRLEKGDDSYGQLHIEKRHGAEIRNEGYESVDRFVEEVASSYDALYQGKNESIILVKRNGPNKLAFVELSNAGEFYTVKSAFISRASYVKHKTLLWERAPSVQPKLPNAVSGQSNLSDTTIAPETEPVKGQTYEEFIEQIEGKPMAAQGEGRPSPSARVREQEKKKTLKRIIRETTGQVRPDRLVTEMAALEAAMKKAEQASRVAYRAGDRAGALREHARLKEMEQIRRNYQAVQSEARNSLRWLETVGKKLDRKQIDVEYKDAIRAVLAGNADGLTAFIARMQEQGDEVFIPDDAIETLREMTGNREDLTLEQLRNQISLVKMLSHQGRAKRLITVFNEKVAVHEAVDEMVSEIKETFAVDMEKTLPMTPSERKAAKGRFQIIKDTIEGLHNILVKAEYIFDKAAGYRKHSAVKKYTFDRIVEAENKATKRGFEIGQKLKDAFSLIQGTIKEIMTEQAIEVGGRKFTREEAIMVALNAGNEGNRERLRLGYQLTDAQIDAIVDSLGTNERAFVDSIFSIVNSQAKELADVYLKLTGERMKFVEGKYFPIITDKELSDRARQQAVEEDLFRNVFRNATVARGFTKKRVGGVDAPLLKFDVIAKHLRDTNHFISHAIPVRDVNRILHNDAFKQAMIGSVGESAYKQLPAWLKAIANPYHEALTAWDRIAGKLRSNAATAILGYSLSVAILQPSAYFQAINRLGFTRSLRGLIDFYRNYDENMELIYSLSPFMQARTMTFDADLKNIMDGDTDRLWKTNRMRETFYALMSWTDKMVTMPSWWTAYNEELRRTEDQGKAVAYADQIVRNTQSSGAAKDLAEIQRGNNTRKLFVMFYSYFSSTYNEMAKSVEMVRTGKAGFSELIKSAWWLSVLPALLATLLKKREETTAEDIVKGIIGYTAGAIPIVGSFVNSLLENYEFRPTPIASLPTEIIRFFYSKDMPKAIKHGIMATGYLFGLPTRQAVLTGEFLIDAFEGEVNPERLLYAEQKKRR